MWSLTKTSTSDPLKSWGVGGKKVGKNPEPHQFLGIKHLQKADKKPKAGPQPF